MILPNRFLAIILSIAAAPLLYGQSPSQEALHRERVRRAQEEFYRTRAWPAAAIPAGARQAAIAEMNRMRERERSAAPRDAAPAWQSIGPRPINTLPASAGSGTGIGAPYTAGRVAAVAVDPRDPNIAYLGASGGGVWKTTDGGRNWTPLTDDQPSLATGSIAIAPSQPDTVYVGTGEQNNSSDSYYGAGVLKTTDGGATWTQLAGPFVGPFSSSRLSGGGARIGALAVHPSDASIVLAAADRSPATTAGIYRTADGGLTWRLVLPGAVGTDVVFNPADPSIVYAALGSAGSSPSNGVYKSTDGGLTWTRATGGLPTTNLGRIALAIAPSSPSTVFASIHNSASQALLGLYKSTDASQTWTRLGAPDYCNPQCSYNNVVRVHPTNSNLVIAAGLASYQSTNGGSTWAVISLGADGVPTHTDHHGLAFAADGSLLYAANDGGVYSTGTAGSSSMLWNNLNATLAITEFTTNVSIHPINPKIAYAGTQDNGTLRYSGNMAWDEIVGGDGGSTALDQALGNIWYGAYQGPQIYRVAAESFNTVQNPFFGPSPILTNGMISGDRYLSYPPLVMDGSSPQRLYFGSQRLYQTDDGAGTWRAISPDLTGGNGAITAIAVSPANPRAVAIGTSTGKLQITDAPRQGASTPWADRTAGLPARTVAQVAWDPVDSQTLYAAFSGFSGFLTNDNAGHLFRSSDYGQTWTDISGNLPNIPLNDVVADPDLPGTLYVASDIGVFQSADGGATWSTLSNGLPRVLVRSLNLHRPSRTLRAVTYGRSMWDLALPGPSNGPLVDSAASVADAAGGATVTVSGSNFSAASRIRWNGEDRAATFVNSGTLRVALAAADLAKPGRGTLAVFNPGPRGGLSNPVNVPVGAPPSLTASGVLTIGGTASAVVPGGIAMLTGSNLAPEATSAAVPPLPYILGGVIVTFNGLPASLFYVSPTQINFQTPWELEGFDSAILKVTNGTLASATIPVRVVAAAPAIFSTDGSGGGQGAVLISGTASLAAPDGAFPGSRPVKRGEYVEIYATGLGQVSRTQGDGQPKPPTTSPAIARTPVVTIGGAPATVLFSGLAPGAVGLYQINVQVPATAATGDVVPIAITVAGAPSNTVTIAVR